LDGKRNMGIGIGDKGLCGRVHGQNSDVIRILIWFWKEMTNIFCVYFDEHCYGCFKKYKQKSCRTLDTMLFTFD